MGTTSSRLPARLESDELTVPQAFDQLLQSLQIEKYKAEASRQQEILRKRLEAKIKLLVTYLTGSYRRNTQIFPLNDIDLLLVLDPEEYMALLEDAVGGPTAALDLIETALRESYPNNEMERFDRCVRIQFAGTGIGFDVAPAFQQGEDVFVIPDESLPGWVPTNPKEHERLISEANQGACGGMLVPLVKLLKAANDHLETEVTGFHIEMMAYHALQYTPENYRTGVAALLRELAARVYGAVPDPWPYGRPVDEYLSWTDRCEAAAALSRAGDRASDALAAEQRDDREAAHAAWRDVFGKWYPLAEKAERASRLSIPAAVRALANSSRISATSAGLVAPSPGLASVRTGTTHGGQTAPHRMRPWSGEAPEVEWHEHEIKKVLRQFNYLTRISPAEAAEDPELWPVHEGDVESLYAVLVGEQRTNLGARHRLLILIPKDAPAIEPAIYDLRPYRPARITSRGWRPKRGLIHRWGGGVLCTHAARDRWDGQLVTLVIWAVDWLFRQDYRQRFGKWIGPQIDRGGRLVVNGVIHVTDSRLRKRGRRGRRVPV